MIIEYMWEISMKYFARNYEMFKFAFIGATGSILNLGILYILTNYILIWYIISAIIAVECSILWNFYLNTKITFKYRFSNKSEVFAAVFRYHLSSLASLVIIVSNATFLR